MAQLLFFDDGHKYELDGEILPSVSEIIRFISREIYGEARQYTLDNAADRGKRVHKACEVLDTTKQVNCDDDIVEYVKGYIKFIKENQPQYSLIEKAMYHPLKAYAGTIDRAGFKENRLCIWDIKTTAQIKTALVKAQLNGYAEMYEVSTSQKVDELYIIHLLPDGTYKQIPVERDGKEFEACLTLHNSLKKKKRGKK